MENKDSGNSFTLGLLIGAAVGVALGFLYAPKPGTETREMLKQRAEDAKKRAEELAEKTREAAADAKKKVEGRFKPAEGEEAA